MQEKWLIGEVAALFDVTTDTLRYYEKIGLLCSRKEAHNGYRYYHYEDVIRLMDILFLRQLELPLKEVQSVLTTLDVGGIHHLLQEQEAAVARKISELQELQQKLATVRRSYAGCAERLGQYWLATAAPFVYKVLGAPDEDLMAMLRKYKAVTTHWMLMVQYSLLLSVQTQPLDFREAAQGFSLEPTEAAALPAELQANLATLAGDCFACTVLATDYRGSERPALNDWLRWVRKQPYQLGDVIVARHIASSHQAGLDYYEVWLPLKNA